MAGQITIAAETTSLFDSKKFDAFLTGQNAARKSTTNEYQQAAWHLDGITITQYAKKIVIQGKMSDHNSSIIRKISAFDGLILDQKNKDALSSLMPKQHNAIICGKCSKPSISIEAQIQGLEIKFMRECSHADDMDSPLMMINNRILPDISILVSQSLSRLIDLGHFVGFEIVIPQFVMNVVDTLDGQRKSSVSKEIASLKSHETAGKITVKDITDNYADIAKFLPQEDNVLIDISDMVNAILITGDRTMKSKAQLKNRPVIFIPRETHAAIKTAQQVRI